MKRVVVGCLLLVALAIQAACIKNAPSVSVGSSPSGLALWKSKCGACHLRPSPDQQSFETWQGILRDHPRRIPLTDEQLDAIARHLSEVN
jgi:hypothetical protein